MIHKFKSGILENDKNVSLIKNISGAFIIKGMSLIISLFTLPAYINYFDNNMVLGVWFTLLSVMQWIFTFDVGIGNGLRNCLTKAIVKNDKTEIKQYISSAYLLLILVAMFFLVVGLAIIRIMDWNHLLNINNNIISRDILTFAVYIIFIGIIVQFILKLVSSILYALQKSAINNLIALLVSALQLIALFVLPQKSPSMNLLNICIAYSVIVNTIYLVSTFIIFENKAIKGCGISLKYFIKEKAFETINLGLIFLWAQVLHMLINLTNDFMVTRFTSPAYEVEYSIYYRLFSLISTVYMLALTPLWSAVTKAEAEKDYKWLKRIYSICNKATIFGVIAEFLFIIPIQLIVNIWLGSNAIDINYFYAIIFAAFGSVSIIQSTQATFASGFGKLKLQCICYTIGIVFKFGFVIIGTYIYENAWILVVLANVIIILPYCIIQPHYIKKDIEKIQVRE